MFTLFCHCINSISIPLTRSGMSSSLFWMDDEDRKKFPPGSYTRSSLGGIRVQLASDAGNTSEEIIARSGFGSRGYYMEPEFRRRNHKDAMWTKVRLYVQKPYIESVQYTVIAECPLPVNWVPADAKKPKIEVPIEMAKFIFHVKQSAKGAWLLDKVQLCWISRDILDQTISEIPWVAAHNAKIKDTTDRTNKRAGEVLDIVERMKQVVQKLETAVKYAKRTEDLPDDDEIRRQMRDALRTKDSRESHLLQAVADDAYYDRACMTRHRSMSAERYSGDGGVARRRLVFEDEIDLDERLTPTNEETQCCVGHPLPQLVVSSSPNVHVSKRTCL